VNSQKRHSRTRRGNHRIAAIVDLERLDARSSEDGVKPLCATRRGLDVVFRQRSPGVFQPQNCSASMPGLNAPKPSHSSPDRCREARSSSRRAPCPCQTEPGAVDSWSRVRWLLAVRLQVLESAHVVQRSRLDEHDPHIDTNGSSILRTFLLAVSGCKLDFVDFGEPSHVGHWSPKPAAISSLVRAFSTESCNSPRRWPSSHLHLPRPQPFTVDDVGFRSPHLAS